MWRLRVTQKVDNYSDSSAGNNSRSPDIVRQKLIGEMANFTLWSGTVTAHLTGTSWVISLDVLWVNKLYPVQCVKCPTKWKIWKDICPVNKEKFFPAVIQVSPVQSKLESEH